MQPVECNQPAATTLTNLN